jgi:hypothetical protein
MQIKKIIPFAIVIVAVSLVSWGVVAHRSIAKIAENHLTPKTKTAVYALLGTESMPLVSTYADEIRSDNNYDYTSSWHYVNPPQGLNYNQFVNYLKTDTAANIYNALLKMERQLKNNKSNKVEKAFALKMIIHFVGDLHQPMHVSRAEDQGGNKIKVKFQRRESNLHSLWDSGLIEYNGFSFTEMATDLDRVSEVKIKEWQNDSVTKWLFESYQISANLYAEIEKNADLDYTYYPQHSEIYRERMQKAGIRLAGFLNNIYK